ncbi:hypothetical protein CYMTET_23059 [Cymbomonas tetramitiformis]|uniref:EF-hand domain-containing protein n=1 Tax=Cymbomonas tetramitiformis TaxID=36881 RepID=A0AAE0FZ17_9CHLO|nr:hypothetical protein CYMTET_23059 [Cymbomonas tetramitiformis]
MRLACLNLPPPVVNTINGALPSVTTSVKSIRSTPRGPLRLSAADGEVFDNLEDAKAALRQIKAKRIFDFFDKNEDGRLNSEEFQAYADVVCGNFEPDLDSFWNDHVKFLAGDDVDDDQGGLSFTGFYQNLCANMSEAQIEADALKLGNPTTKDNFRTVFDFFDQDRDGRLDKKELTLLAVTGAHGTSFYGKNLWEYLEAPPNETVEYLTSELLYAFYGEYVDCMSFEMFLECGCEYLPVRDSVPNILRQVKSGAIDFEKLEKAMELAVPRSEPVAAPELHPKAQALFDKCDVDGDGRLNREEMLTLLTAMDTPDPEQLVNALFGPPMDDKVITELRKLVGASVEILTLLNPLVPDFESAIDEAYEKLIGSEPVAAPELHPKAQALFDKCDVDGDGRLNREEMLTLFAAMDTPDPEKLVNALLGPPMDDKVITEFQQFVDNVGASVGILTCDVPDLESAIDEAYENLIGSEPVAAPELHPKAQALFDKCDVDGDGRLNREEMLTLFAAMDTPDPEKLVNALLGPPMDDKVITEFQQFVDNMAEAAEARMKQQDMRGIHNPKTAQKLKAEVAKPKYEDRRNDELVQGWGS